MNELEDLRRWCIAQAMDLLRTGGSKMTFTDKDVLDVAARLEEHILRDKTSCSQYLHLFREKV